MSILRVDQQRLQVVDAANHLKEAGITLAERESAVRKAALGMEKAEIDILKGKEQRSASMASKIGGMTPAQQAKTLNALKMAQRVGLNNMAPSMRGLVQNFMPMYAQKEFEKTAANTALWKEAEKMGGKDFITGDFAGIRKEIQEKSANFQVNIVLDKAALSKDIAAATSAALKDLIKEIEVKNAQAIQGLQLGMQQRNINS